MPHKVKVQQLDDVDASAIGNLKILQYQTATNKHVYIATPSSGSAVAVKGATAKVNSADQTINNNTDTAVAWDTSVLDENSYLNVGGGTPSRFTIPTTGWYSLAGSVEWETNSTGDRTLYWRKNGTTTIEGSYSRETPRTANFQPAYSSATIAKLTAADYVELMVRQDSGGNRVLKAGVNTSGSVTGPLASA